MESKCSEFSRLMPLLHLLLLALLFGVEWTHGSIPVTDDMIKKFLTPLIAAEKASPSRSGQLMDQAAILDRYTNGVYGAPSIDGNVKLKDVIKLHISLKSGAITLTYRDECDIGDQEELTKVIEDFTSAGKNQKSVYDHYKKMDGSGKKYCNFNLYLVCQHEMTQDAAAAAAATSNQHKCLCPSDMIWEVDKCVFQRGARCDAHSRGGLQILELDFLTSFYTRSAAEETRYTLHPTKSICQEEKNKHYYCDSKGSGLCRLSIAQKYFVTVQEIADFLKAHLESEGNNEESTQEIMKAALKDIDKPEGSSTRALLSLEVLSQKLLLEHGKSCDYNQNKPFNEFMKDFNGYRENKRQIEIIRKEFQMKAIDSKAQVCDPFKFLHCVAGTGACACKGDKVHQDGHCKARHKFACEHDHIRFEVKHYKFGVYQYIRDYFEYYRVPCEQGTTCEHLRGSYSPLCFNSADLASFGTLQTNFEKKFSLNVNEPCSLPEQTEMLQVGKNILNLLTNRNEFPTLEESRKSIQALIDKSDVKYCKIRNFALCSKDGKCSCVPPGVPEDVGCVFPRGADCGVWHFEWEKKHNIVERQYLDFFPILQSKDVQEIFCTSGSTCHHTRVCKCDPNLRGDLCDVETSLHLDHLDVINLPDSMRTPEGQKVLLDFHSALTELETRMVLEYSATCHEGDNTRFNNILDRLAKVRQACDCFWNTIQWKCQDSACATDPDLQKPALEALLHEAQAIVASKTQLCNWNNGIRCVSGTCTCPPDNFFEDNDKCRVDMGANCYQFYYNTQGFSRRCRKDLSCGSNGICQIRDFYHFDQGRQDDSIRGLAYVKYIKNAVVKFIEARKKTIKENSHRKQEPGRTCEYKYEKRVKEALSEADALLEAVKVDGSIDQERQNVRMLNKVARKFPRSTDDLYCDWKKGSVCDPKTSMCTAYDDTTDPDKTTVPNKDESSTSVSVTIKPCITIVTTGVATVVAHLH